MDEMLTPTDIQKHLKIGRNKTYQLIQLSSFPINKGEIRVKFLRSACFIRL